MIAGLQVRDFHQANIIQVREIARVFQHQRYNARFVGEHDIALIKTTKPFVFNNYVHPIQLVEQGFDPKGICRLEL